MERFIQLGSKVFKLSCSENYNKEKADKMSRGLSDDAMENTYIEGTIKVTSIEILLSEYKLESIHIHRSEVERLHRFIHEVEHEKCKQTLMEYYQ